MRALAIDYVRRELCEREAAEPRLEGDCDVLLRVMHVGVCGTDRDLAAFRIGRGPEGDDFLIPGHEAACSVVQTGPAVQRVGPGDIVVPVVRRACAPPCRWCLGGRRDLCDTGRYTERGIVGAHGYFTEFAVDHERDLVPIPAACSTHAVLLEPLSVVEKAIDVARRLHPGEPRKVLVLGAGSIGLLAAAVLQLRGFESTVVSVEPKGSPRSRLVQSAGAWYENDAPSSEFDIAIEAAGAPSAVSAGLSSLRPNGVLVVLGARTFEGRLPLLDVILGNRTMAGSVNAGPQHFASAAEDLGRIPVELRNSMIEFRAWGDYRSSFVGEGTAATAPKVVHVIGV